VVLGVIYGFVAALGQSISYFCTRLFVIRRAQGVIRLLVLGHLLMGAASALLLPLVWPERMPPAGGFFWPLMGTAWFYLLGQAGFFFALRHIDASRVSPMLGLKIVILAAITVLILGRTLSPLKWAGVVLSVAAAFVLNYSGRSLSWRVLGGVLFACVMYSLSDLSIRVLVDAVRFPGGSPGGSGGGLGLVRASLVSVFMTYVLCGLVSLPLLIWAGPKALGDLKYALPFAASWLGAMLFLFACFGSIDVLFGNIIQSTRGLMTVLIGAGIAALGMVHLEGRTTRAVLLRRLGAAAMMSAAIVLFVVG